jgi:hypothetical protein
MLANAAIDGAAGQDVVERLSRLVIAWETVDEVLSEASADAPPAVERELTTAAPLAGDRCDDGAAVAGRLEVSVLPQEYRDLLEVAEDAGRPLRAAQIAAAAGLSTDRGKVETLRSKLKRLTERGWLAEDAGLFALPARDGDGAGMQQRRSSVASPLPPLSEHRRAGPGPARGRGPSAQQPRMRPRGARWRYSSSARSGYGRGSLSTAIRICPVTSRSRCHEHHRE